MQLCIFIIKLAGKSFVKVLKQTVPTVEAGCSQFAGRWLTLKANKAWRACGEQRGLAFKGRVRVYICLCLRGGMPGMWAISGNLDASNSTWEDQHSLTSRRPLMRNQGFLYLHMSNSGTLIHWQASITLMPNCSYSSRMLQPLSQSRWKKIGWLQSRL